LRASRYLVSFALLLLLWPVRTGLRAGQARQPRKPAAAQAQKLAPVPGRMWKSQTTGHEFRVWTEDSRFHAEWTNIPPASAAKGAYIRTVCRRAGEKWVGESQSYLPCVAGEGKNEHLMNFCHVTTGFEIDSMTASRIDGRTEALKRFDCAKCQVLEKEWKPFVWVTLPPKTGAGHQIPESH
jgi:hypothetical protein